MTRRPDCPDPGRTTGPLLKRLKQGTGPLQSSDPGRTGPGLIILLSITDVSSAFIAGVGFTEFCRYKTSTILFNIATLCQ
ncbi:hypothetical protein HanIR_Chr16g0813991 [Helianthus annuus]|nr:hypothetical protein HanIR_Chr16g0813991 [Helianthus annuus]